MCKIHVSIFWLDLGWKRVSLVAIMEGLCCVPLLYFQCCRGWGRGEGKLFLCDDADVTEQISAFVLNKADTGFTYTQGFFIHLRLGLCQGGQWNYRNPFLCPFLHRDFVKCFPGREWWWLMWVRPPASWQRVVFERLGLCELRRAKWSICSPYRGCICIHKKENWKMCLSQALGTFWQSH